MNNYPAHKRVIKSLARLMTVSRLNMKSITSLRFIWMKLFHVHVKVCYTYFINIKYNNCYTSTTFENTSDLEWSYKTYFVHMLTK